MQRKKSHKSRWVTANSFIIVIMVGFILFKNVAFIVFAVLTEACIVNP